MRQPVQTLYGGAHLFRADSLRKLGAISLKALDLSASERTRDRVRRKLETEPVEDLRIDFEDGYGVRSDAEEDRHAVEAARHLSAADPLPPFIGIRIRSFAPETRARAERTLHLFLNALTRVPPNFAVTLPKISRVDELADLARMLPADMAIEAMIETPQILPHLRQLLPASEGRLRGAHFGPYDFTSACGILSVDQDLHHPLCDTARHQMVLAFAGTGVTLADGPTSTLPLGSDAEAARVAWRKHYDNVRRSMRHGFYQSWDLHPAQLPARYAAIYDTYLDNLEPNAARLRNFLEKSEQATAAGTVFDDAATVRGLRLFFDRAVDCGCLSRDELPLLSHSKPQAAL